MQQFIHRKNIENYKRRLVEPLEPMERTMLLALLAEEEAKEPTPARVPKDD
jgi:hypothetical protein